MIAQHRPGQASAQLEAIAGSNPNRAAELTILAALWRADLASDVAPKLRATMFQDELLKAAAAYSVGAVGTYGVNDVTTVRRLLFERFRSEPVYLILKILDRLAAYVAPGDVDDAIALLELRSTP